MHKVKAKYFLCLPPFRRKAEGLSFCLSVFPSIRPSFRPPIEVGTLWGGGGGGGQLLLQFYTDYFETSLVLWSWSEDLHVVLRLLFFFFLQVELSHFSGIIYNNVNGQGIPCGRNSSYSFIPILLKLHLCFGHGLKICIWFGY